MPAHIQREAMPPRKVRDHLIPTSCVKSRGVTKQDRGISARPFPQRNFNPIARDSAVDGHSLFSLSAIIRNLTNFVITSIVPKRLLGVIPARFASSRFPGKSLTLIAGKSMLQHVYERTSQARYLTKVIIATDDQRIYDAARGFGAQVQMTRSDHP